jgi:co-chaperonin GroES (HSP10)
LPAHHRLRTIHVEDPRDVIWGSVGKELELVEPMNQQVLVALYIRPATRTASGLEIAPEAVDEDRYQGKIGMVLKKGPRAFVDDGPVKFHGQDVEPGDWVVYRASDGLKGMIGDREIRFIPDVYIKAKIDHPDAVF